MFDSSTRQPLSSNRLCPRCGDHALRVRRRLIDRILHPIVPVRRYRCMSAACKWVGNIKPRPRADGHRAAGESVLDAPRGQF